MPIVIVGLRFGRRIVKQLARAGVRYGVDVVGVCDLDLTLARRIAIEFGVTAYPDLPAVLADDQVSAVALFTGPAGRSGLVRQVVRAGKHVMTTKPFELDADAALAVLREAAQIGRVVHCNSPAPLLPRDLARIQQWREMHSLGRPVAARATTWAAYRESPDGSWYDDPQRCPAAPILRLGIYLINDLLRLFGPAARVQVLTSRLATGRPTVDNAQLAIGFANGALATVFASFCVADGEAYQNALVLNFERGTLYRSPTTGAGGRGSRLSLVTAGDDGVPVHQNCTVAAQSGDYLWKTFARAVQGRQPTNPVTTPEQVAAGIRVLEAMAKAERTGHTETVAPVEVGR